MSFFKWFSENRQHTVEMKVNSLLRSLFNDSDKFTHDEEVYIIKTMYEKYQIIKGKERQQALNLANEITQSLKQIK